MTTEQSVSGTSNCKHPSPFPRRTVHTHIPTPFRPSQSMFTSGATKTSLSLCSVLATRERLMSGKFFWRKALFRAHLWVLLYAPSSNSHSIRTKCKIPLIKSDASSLLFRSVNLEIPMRMPPFCQQAVREWSTSPACFHMRPIERWRSTMTQSTVFW